ncbi:secretin and TonB N-terminal domain-containing protein [Candidatus Caldatribacterium sp.]|uniref:secretin and TonB N-terminal domain-containing protein n=1 Tax=Candidatus Caldatribacterium sp. TaxID=2282143 RepID=UPI00299AD8FB|nr:secretin and TonB N-terminal domain-containing protein [Candidatus Calescibacterium sp.]
MSVLLCLGILVSPVSSLELRDFFFRADNTEIKLTFKFDAPCTWRDVSPDPYHVALDIAGAKRGLPYAERPMHIGPVKKIIFREVEGNLRIWLELKNPAPYEMYDEANGRLISVLFKGPFVPSVEEERFSFEFRDVDVKDALLALAKAKGVNIVVDDSVQGTITLSFENLTFEQALGYILALKGLGQVRLGDNIIVADKRKLEENFGLLKVQRFPLQSIDPERAKEIVALIVPSERVAVDTGGRALIVRGREEEFQKIAELLERVDVALETKVFYLANNIYEDEAQLQRVRELLKIVIPEEERVNYDFTQKAFVVRGTKEEIKAVEELLTNIDRRLPQIMIDAKFVEINREKVKDLGVTWTVGGKEGEITFGELSLGGTLERQDLVEMTIKALEKKNLARLVGNPRILTLGGKTATIHVGDSVPYRDLGVDAEGRLTPGALRFLEVGVTLEVTPILTREGTIVVRAKPRVSTYTEREYVLAGLTFRDPQPSVKSADTTARLRPGETLVIGGLIRSEDIERITRVPILSELPIIGNLFVLRNKTHKETELIVFLTPYVIEY